MFCHVASVCRCCFPVATCSNACPAARPCIAVVDRAAHRCIAKGTASQQPPPAAQHPHPSACRSPAPATTALGDPCCRPRLPLQTHAWAAAKQYYKRALQQAAGSCGAAAHLRYAAATLEAGDAAAARRAYEAACAAHPCTEAWLGMGVASLRMGRCLLGVVVCASSSHSNRMLGATDLALPAPPPPLLPCRRLGAR